MFKKLYLPVGILVAVGLALSWSLPGSWLQHSGMSKMLIVLIFAINGWQVKWRESKVDHRWIMVFIFGAAVSLVGGPVLGRGIGALFFSEPLMILGVTLMAAAPTMIASAIVTTEASGGNAVWALLFTLGFNLFSVVSSPFMLRLCVGGMEGISISPWSLLSKLILLMLLPFLAGAALRRGFRNKIMPVWFGYLPSTAVILIVYGTLSAAAGQLINLSLPLLLKVAVAAMLIHLVLIVVLAWSGSRLFKLRPPENRALFFTGSQKSMVVGISILAALGGSYSDAAVVILIAYFFQLLFDSLLAAYLSRHTVPVI